jgi:hypothetical protein
MLPVTFVFVFSLKGKEKYGAVGHTDLYLIDLWEIQWHE